MRRIDRQERPSPVVRLADAGRFSRVPLLKGTFLEHAPWSIVVSISITTNLVVSGVGRPKPSGRPPPSPLPPNLPYLPREVQRFLTCRTAIAPSSPGRDQEIS